MAFVHFPPVYWVQIKTVHKQLGAKIKVLSLSADVRDEYTKIRLTPKTLTAVSLITKAHNYGVELSLVV